MKKLFALLLLAFIFLQQVAVAQKPVIDSLPPKKDSVAKKKASGDYKPSFWASLAPIDHSKPYSPRIAIYRSAILPGWGQVTNKKYWKLPFVYGALGVTAGIFFHNIKQFREARDAYILATDTSIANDALIPEPYHSVLSNPERIKIFRNQVRQNVDYSVVFFILFWGLNVADAAVDAHLKPFDVSDDLSLQLKAGYSPMAQTNGLSLILHIGDRNKK